MMTDAEKIYEFAQLVRDMRSSQREYFRGRDPITLRQSKALEARVDRACAEILLGTSKTLFDLIEEPSHA